ncbi:MAG TPA: DUF6348 family protein [Gemmatales bacterium]|nr:DUF6348 family protein [Gemmatales bacterium]
MKLFTLLLMVLAFMGCQRRGQATIAPTVTRTETELEEFFVHWLEGHGEKQIVIDNRGVGLASNDVRLSIKIYDTKKQKDGVLSEVEFKITVLGNKEIIEYVAGLGKDEQAAIKDAQLNFMLTTFHVVYKSFMNSADPHQTVEPVELANGKREMIMGDILTRGDQVDLKGMREKIKTAIAKLKLSPGPDWIKIVYSRINNVPQTVAVMVDNQDELKLTQAIKELAWPDSEKFYMSKQFIVIK